MFSDYKKEVVKTYEKKKIAGLLTINLQHPTPAKLRDEWLMVIQENYIPKKDDSLLRNFFGQKDDINEYITCIKNLDPDRFRPLLNYLKGATQDTDEKNIELLAWLIGYEERPFRLNLKPKDHKELLDSDKQDNESLKEVIIEETNNTIKISGSSKTNEDLENNPVKHVKSQFSQTKNRLPYMMLSIGILLIVVIGLIFGKDILQKEECMYWDGNKYVASPCDIKIPNKNIIALDTFNLKYFQKINAIDTLTSYSIGKTWYLKMDNKVEFFTSNGYHPVHVEKQLKATTGYIINKYAIRNDTVSNN